VEGWHLAVERNEMLLLQRHLSRSLQAAAAAVLEDGGDEAAAAAAGGSDGESSRLSRLLAADWIILNVQHPLLLPEMLPLAARQVPASGC
jgi:hypothetical protein